MQNQEYTKNTTLKPQSIIDEIITYSFAKNSSAAFTIKNLFDQDLRVPSYYYRNPGGIIREGHNYHFTLSTKF